jgi:hypothetical protein
MMQKNPKEVMAKYGNNKEFMELFTEFSKMMGGHFEDLAKKTQEPSKPQIDEKAEVMRIFFSL